MIDATGILQDWRSLLVWLAACLFGVYQFSLQSISGLMTTSLMRDFGLDAVTVSYVISSFFYIFLIMQIPAGLILDRLPKRYVLPLAAFLCAIGCLCFARADSIAWLVIGRLISGAGAAFGFVGIISAVKSYFKPQLFAVVVGLSETIGFLGTALCEHSFAQLLHDFNWRTAMTMVAWSGFAISVLLWLSLQPRMAPAHDHNPPSHQSSVLSHLAAVVREPRQWLLGLISFCFFAVICVYAALWGAPALAVMYHLHLTDAASAIAMILVGVALGALVMGVVSHRPAWQVPTMLLSALACVALMTVVVFDLALPFAWLLALLLLLGVFASAYVICFAICGQIAVPGAGAASVGFVNMITMSAALLLQPVMGWLISLHGPSVWAQDAPIYRVSDYQRGSVLMIVLFFTAFLAAMVLKRFFTRHNLETELDALQVS